MHEQSRRFPVAPPRWKSIKGPSVVAALVFVQPSAHAAFINECRLTDTDFTCRLRSVLTFLDAAAAILALLLVFAIVAAVRAYRRKPGKLAPKDITTDAK